MEHIESAIALPTAQVIDLRQQAGTELSFVTLANGASSTDVILDTLGVAPGTYSIVLQSCDSSSLLQPTLMTDTITIIVEESLAYFIEDLESQSLVAD